MSGPQSGLGNMRHTSTSGFTLIELMVTIAILGVLLAIGLPSFQGSLRSNRVSTTTNELMASFALARTEAIRSARGSGLCTSTDGAACGGTWDDGWLVWIDNDANGTPGGANDRVVRYIQGHDKLVMTATAAGGGDPLVILFDNRGRVDDNNTRQVVLQPDICPTGMDLSRDVDLNATGQVRITRKVCP